jgi:hypothetical protein
VLDSQGQIVAYALVFGVAQQALSGLLDRQAQRLLEGLPGGTATEPRPPGPGKLQEPPAGTVTVGQPMQPAGGTPVVETPAATDITTAGIGEAAGTDVAGGTREATDTEAARAEPVAASTEECPGWRGGGEPGDRPVMELERASREEPV